MHALFSVSGLDDRDAAIMADSLVDADLRGTHSHGVIRLPFLVERLLKGGAKLGGLETQTHMDIDVAPGATAAAIKDLASLGRNRLELRTIEARL